MSNFYPVICSDSLDQVVSQVELAKRLPGVEVIQIDITDGLLVEAPTIILEDLLSIDFAELKIDIHFMTQEPIDDVYNLIDFCSNLPVRSVVSQIERMSDQSAYVELVDSQGWKAGLSLMIFTPLTELELSDSKVEIIQLLGSEGGQQGLSLNQMIFQKIKDCRQLVSDYGLTVELMIDSGVKMFNAKQLLSAGADSLVVGSELWNAKHPKEVNNFFQQLESKP